MRALKQSAIAALLAVSLSACGYDTSGPGYSSNPPGSVDGLWTGAASNPALLRLDPSQLLASGAITAATAVTTSSAALFELDGVTFDTDGTMWVTSDNDSRLLAFAPASLAQSGTKPANIVITANDGSLNRPAAIAFDKQHHLWVANFGNHTIVRFESSELASSGAAASTLFIDTGVNPSALAFDASGNLWVASIQSNKIFSYNHLQQQTAGVLEPNIVINTNGTSVQHPSGLAFDAAGNLWVASLTNSLIDAFTPAQLTASGSPNPTITLSSNAAGSLAGPVSLAFDSDGSLWVMEDGGTLNKFARASLQQSGAPAPALTLTVTGYSLFWNVAFWPKVAGLPIN
ncbi:MAG TPA: NHL repeat-containing protein [Gemmatimonadaceae bacterium]|nr:NHL repeat-containing protein [Gemmatimonadaceae bacterium]